MFCPRHASIPSIVLDHAPDIPRVQKRSSPSPRRSPAKPAQVALRLSPAALGGASQPYWAHQLPIPLTLL